MVGHHARLAGLKTQAASLHHAAKNKRSFSIKKMEFGILWIDREPFRGKLSDFLFLTQRSVSTSKERLQQNGLKVPVEYLCNLPVKMHEDQFCYCW